MCVIMKTSNQVITLTADALAITFAVPVPVGVRDGMQRGNRRQQAEYDPYAALNRGHDPVSLSQRI